MRSFQIYIHREFSQMQMICSPSSVDMYFVLIKHAIKCIGKISIYVLNLKIPIAKRWSFSIFNNFSSYIKGYMILPCNLIINLQT